MFHTIVSFISCRWASSRSPRSAAYECARRVRNTSRAPREIGERVLGAASERLEDRPGVVDHLHDARVDRHRAAGVRRPGHHRCAQIGGERRSEQRAGLGRGDRHPGIGAGERRQQQRGVLDGSAHGPLDRQVLPGVRGRPRRHATRVTAATPPRCRSSPGCAASRRGRCRRRSAPCRTRARRPPRPMNPRTSSGGRRGSSSRRTPD